MGKLRPVTVYEQYMGTEEEPGTTIKRSVIKTREIGQGFFHAFGINYEELEGVPGHFSTAIVEMLNGEVENIPVELTRFDDKPPE